MKLPWSGWKEKEKEREAEREKERERVYASMGFHPVRSETPMRRRQVFAEIHTVLGRELREGERCIVMTTEGTYDGLFFGDDWRLYPALGRGPIHGVVRAVVPYTELADDMV